MALNKDEKTRLPLKTAVLKTLAYSDIFDFPLTKDEIWKYIFAGTAFKRSYFENVLHKLNGKIIKKDGYYCLVGREKIIEKRKKNIKYVKNKLQIAEKASTAISAVPTILFIGISGGLSIGDAEATDDIDFFIITKKGTLFKTRLLVLIILQILGLRRKRLEKNPANKICVNFLIDETKLSFPEERRDIYTAHEILQIKPLLVRENIYERFLKANSWIHNFLSNSTPADIKKIHKEKTSLGLRSFVFLITFLFNERLSRVTQITLMKKHIRGELITKHIMAFNPNDYRVQTLNKLSLKLRELGLLTKR